MTESLGEFLQGRIVHGVGSDRPTPMVCDVCGFPLDDPDHQPHDSEERRS